MRVPADAALVGPVALPEEVVHLLGLRALRFRTVPVASALRASRPARLLSPRVPWTRRVWIRIGLGVVAAAALAPGWAGTLVPVPHDELIAAAARSGSAMGITRAGEGRGDEWHLQYLDPRFARLLADVGLRGVLPSLVPPDFAAHVPAPVGPREVATRADGYYRVETSLRWPWWLPGGGVRWDAGPPR